MPNILEATVHLRAHVRQEERLVEGVLRAAVVAGGGEVSAVVPTALEELFEKISEKISVLLP